MRVLIVHAGREGQSAKIAARAAEQVSAAGHAIEIVDLKHAEAPNPGGFALTIVIGSVHVGRHEPELTAFVKHHRDGLAETASVFFSVSLSAAEGAGHDDAGARRQAQTFLDACDWSPDLVETVAGALRFSRYGFFTGLLMQLLLRRIGTRTNRRQDIEYTDWPALDEAVERALAKSEEKNAAQA
jgi:menaquinone-dependent protoporphyrinogen oxidase